MSCPQTPPPARGARRRPGAAGRIVATTVVLLLSACTHAPSLVRTAIGDAPGGLAMRPCLHRDSIPAECGTLTVPERRGAIGSRLISIPVIRVRAVGAGAQDPIFFLEGGPGMSNQRRRPPGWARRSHDFVLVGYRGIDGSERLDCPELTEAIQ